MQQYDSIEITRPDDWHLHLRDGAAMADVVGFSARQFARAIVMPNLKPPVVTTEQALAYRARILAALPEGSRFEPLMTLYLTDRTTPDEIERAKDSGVVVACKLYPAGATTNSESGVTDIPQLQPVLEAMRAAGMPLLVHGEVTDEAIDIFDREPVFIERVLRLLVDQVPGLKIVLEHVTTAEAVNFVRSGPETLAATITPHHLLYNRNAILAGGIRPHFYCLPVLKRERHRLALVEAATSGHPRFFLGTDSAPHAIGTKECSCGCAGHLQRPCRAGSLRRGLRPGRRARPARRLRQSAWTGFLRPAPQPGAHQADPRSLDPARALCVRRQSGGSDVCR
jgi:dihydroorotase